MLPSTSRIRLTSSIRATLRSVVRPLLSSAAHSSATPAFLLDFTSICPTGAYRRPPAGASGRGAERDDLGVERLTDAGEHLEAEVLVTPLDPVDRALAGAEDVGQLRLGVAAVLAGVPDEVADPAQVVLAHAGRRYLICEIPLTPARGPGSGYAGAGLPIGPGARAAARPARRRRCGDGGADAVELARRTGRLVEHLRPRLDGGGAVDVPCPAGVAVAVNRSVVVCQKPRTGIQCTSGLTSAPRGLSHAPECQSSAGDQSRPGPRGAPGRPPATACATGRPARRAPRSTRPPGRLRRRR